MMLDTLIELLQAERARRGNLEVVFQEPSTGGAVPIVSVEQFSDLVMISGDDL